MYICSRVILYPWAIEFKLICCFHLCAISCEFSRAVYGLFLRWKTPSSGTFCSAVSSFPEWCFVPLLTACHYLTRLLLMICHCFSTVLSSCLIAFGFSPLFIYFDLLNYLCSSLIGALPISKCPGTSISICYFSI